jgi:hypothetical protein
MEPLKASFNYEEIFPVNARWANPGGPQEVAEVEEDVLDDGDSGLGSVSLETLEDKTPGLLACHVVSRPCGGTLLLPRSNM